jgi:2-oxoglutarate ferredoxin oxidoreductase subunit alpha
MREFINGGDAIVRGALDAGCDFFAGYPITPATPILLQMIAELPKVDGTALQAEDEIAAIGVCIGAAMTGARVMTATSGPGISLYSENIGMAIMGEVPMVIVDCQRMGPATGGATSVGQGDIQFLRWGTSGGYPAIVLSPAIVADCYRLTCKAFDLAERFRTPVFLSTDKEILATNTTVPVDALLAAPVRERRLASDTEAFVAYQVDSPDEAPPMSPFGGAHIVRFSTSSHDEQGYMTKDPQAVGRLNEHLWAKIAQHVDETVDVQFDLQPGAITLVVGYGITAQAMMAAVRIARAGGSPVSALTVNSLWPVPVENIRTALKGIERVVVPELNHGQYRREIERLATQEQQVVGVNRVDGELITPAQILEEV